MNIAINVVVVIAVVAIVELAKKFVFKDDPKYKLIYTFAPVVLCAIAYVIIALVQKTDVWASLALGASLGLTCMGSYDALAAIIRSWKTKSPAEIAQEVGEIIGNKKQDAKK